MFHIFPGISNAHMHSQLIYYSIVGKTTRLKSQSPWHTISTVILCFVLIYSMWFSRSEHVGQSRHSFKALYLTCAASDGRQTDSATGWWRGWTVKQIFFSRAGGDENKTERRVNIELQFVRCPEKELAGVCRTCRQLCVFQPESSSQSNQRYQR